MRKHVLLNRWLSMICLATFGLGSTVFSQEIDLVGLLIKNLGVIDQQAEGGAGAIFKAALHTFKPCMFDRPIVPWPEYP